MRSGGWGGAAVCGSGCGGEGILSEGLRQRMRQGGVCVETGEVLGRELGRDNWMKKRRGAVWDGVLWEEWVWAEGSGRGGVEKHAWELIREPCFCIF